MKWNLLVFCLLKRAQNAAAFNKKGNPIETYIKKAKFALKTISVQEFKDLLANLKPQNFELFLEYIKASIESTVHTLRLQSNLWNPKSLGYKWV